MAFSEAITVQQHALGAGPLMAYTYSCEAMQAQPDNADSGKVPDSSTPIFVTSHGLAGSIALEDQIGLPDWRPLASRLRLVRYDAYGHGHSGGCEQAERYDWPRQAADMAQVLNWVHHRFPPSIPNTSSNAEATPDIVLGGCSMSAAVALHLMCQVAAGQWAQAPWVPRIKALALTIPPAGWSLRAKSVDQYRGLAAILQKDGLTGYLRALSLRRPIAYIESVRPDFQKVTRTHASKMSAERLAAFFTGAALADYPQRAALEQLEIPTLLLARGADAFHPEAMSRTLSEIMPNAMMFCAHSAQDIMSWPRRVQWLAESEDVHHWLQLASASSDDHDNMPDKGA